MSGPRGEFAHTTQPRISRSYTQGPNVPSSIIILPLRLKVQSSSPTTLRYLSSSVIATMSHHNYPNHGRFRQSPTGGDSGSSYSEQGRTILPPLTIAFPTSNSPGSLFNDAAAHPHLNSTLFASFDTVSNTGNYPSTYPTAQRSTPVPYEQPYCM